MGAVPTLPCFLRLENVSPIPRLRVAVRDAIGANLLVETIGGLLRTMKWISGFFSWRKEGVDFRATAITRTAQREGYLDTKGLECRRAGLRGCTVIWLF